MLLLVILPSVLLLRSAVADSQEHVAVEWRFDTEGDLRGWAAGGHVRDVRVTGGALVGEATDWDPILLGPVFEIDATPTQRVEIEMKTSQPGEVQLFWTETLEAKFGGFSEKKSNRFAVRGDDRFHVHCIHPFWHAAGKIIRFRLDPPSAGRFAIASIRVVDEGLPSPSPAKAWTFDADPQGWRAWRDLSEPAVRQGHLEIKAQGKSPLLMSPLISVAADEHPFVSIRMATERGSTGRVFCVSSTQFGWEDVSFPLRADGKMHAYNVDVGHLGHWRDEIILLGVQPTDVEGAAAAIESIEIADAPRGPAELEIGYFGAADAINRAGRPVEITMTLRNRGGDPARNVTATLLPPAEASLAGPLEQTIEAVTPYLPKRVSWRIRSIIGRKSKFLVRVKCPGAETVSAETTVELTPVPDVPRTAYIPEPQPVGSEYDVGAFYFPGWHSMSRWQPILDFPLRKPVLGWYDESDPECADWQIKWAVEHGITFYMVDWYWCQGNRHLEHWLHDAYMNARFREHLKWAIMWANHNPPNTHSLEDWRAVTQYWIDHYLGMEEYYRIDGRPAVFIWAPANVLRDVGGSDEAAKLYALSQKMARDVGLPGIYFVAMSSHESEPACRQLKAEGYEAFTSYHGFQLAAQRAGTRRFPFADVVETSPEVWEQADGRASGLLYIPIADTGWSSEPWHGSKSRVIYDRTPELFGKLCRAAREYAETTDKKIIAVGPVNEWGEGSYIEPYAEYGFEDLDQLRAAFCPPGDYPPNLIPADVGRGPYDLPPVEPKTAWEFDTDGDFEGWTPNGYLRAEVKDGLLVAETTGHDPILHGPGVQVEAASTRTLSIRMRSDADTTAQLFWATAKSSQGEPNSLHFAVIGDGQFHDYELDLGQSPRWRGLITSLRFDPAAKSGVGLAVDHIQFR
jgi:hypothetical protein